MSVTAYAFSMYSPVIIYVVYAENVYILHTTVVAYSSALWVRIVHDCLNLF